MSYKEERAMILDMIARGKITAEEGDMLLQALGQPTVEKGSVMKDGNGNGRMVSYHASHKEPQSVPLTPQQKT